MIAVFVQKLCQFTHLSYLFSQDPNKPVVRIYSLPDGTFSSEEEESDSEKDDSDEDDDEAQEENAAER